MYKLLLMFIYLYISTRLLHYYCEMLSDSRTFSYYFNETKLTAKFKRIKYYKDSEESLRATCTFIIFLCEINCYVNTIKKRANLKKNDLKIEHCSLAWMRARDVMSVDAIFKNYCPGFLLNHLCREIFLFLSIVRLL